MACPRHSCQQGLRASLGGRTGLVLVEMVLLLVVATLALVLAATAAGRVHHAVRVDAFASQLKTFATILEQRRAEQGRWPRTATETGGLLDAGWARGAPVGGEFEWSPPANGRPGSIALTAFAPNPPLALTSADLLSIDRAIDDGDLRTGRFRTGFNGWPVYLVGGKP